MQTALLTFLQQHDIQYIKFDHPPVFTCEEAREHLAGVPGVGTKNLFLRNKKGDRHFLVAVPEEKRVDLKSLGGSLGVAGLGFGSSERLMQCLGILPGSVTLLAAFNDTNSSVTVLIDEDLRTSDAIQCHPLVNTATLVLSWGEIEKFFRVLDRPMTFIAVPAL